MTIQSHRGKSGDNLPDPEWPKMALHRKSALLIGQSNELDHQKCDEALLETKNARKCIADHPRWGEYVIFSFKERKEKIYHGKL